MGEYETLKRFGTKKHDMKQSYLVRKTVSKTDSLQLEVDERKALKKGMCSGLVAEWVGAMVEDGNSKRFHTPLAATCTGPYRKMLRDWNRMDTALKAIPKQLESHYVYKRQVPRIPDQMPARAMFPASCWERYEYPPTRPAFLALETSSLVPRVAYFVVTESIVGAHAIGIYRADRSTFHFFDPNAGEYEIYLGCLEAFFREYLKIFTNRGRHSEINKIQFLGLKRRKYSGRGRTNNDDSRRKG